MKKILLVIMLATFAIANLQAQKKTFTRDYIYQASETDSKVTARAIATTQIRNILLREVGEFLHTERMLRRDSTFLEYAEKIEDITAGIVEMKMLDEQWSATYYIKAEMTVDPDEVNRRITEVLKKTKELEDARKRALAAEAEVARLKKELANSKPNTRPVTAGNKGDVDRYEPPQPKVYEKALFKSTTDGTDEGDERNKIKDNSLYNGSGKNDEPTRTANTQTGFTTSEQGVSFSLQGRSASGGFPKPA
ncbi:MAG: hypothetical protein LBS69_08730, partial [Prevotellaceae bacterium]|nr:hypothetical protein [Prevotellaceae bacterium]